MSFLKNLFKKDKAEPRSLSHPNELQVKDIIVFSDSFALPEQIRAQQFQVSAINSYEFEHKTTTEWVLEGSSDYQIYLSLDVDDKTYLCLSLKISDSEVEQLFDLDEFSKIFDQPGNAEFDKLTDTPTSQGWTAEAYRQQKFAQMGYFHRKDLRNKKASQYEGEDAGEQFEFYGLIGNDSTYSLHLEVWEDGDTDVFLNCYRPLTDIIDYYPGS